MPRGGKGGWVVWGTGAPRTSQRRRLSIEQRKAESCAKNTENEISFLCKPIGGILLKSN